MRFDPGVLSNDPERRPTILRLLDAGLAAVEPEASVRRSLPRQGSVLEVGDDPIDLGRMGRVWILAFGKAAPAMARGAAGILADRDPIGLVVTDHREEVPEGCELLLASHPVPGHRSVEAGNRALALAGAAGADDLVVCLISGGGSALLERPWNGLSIDHLVTATRELLRSGADIADLNTVRKHLSRIKGGRLGAAVAPARLLTLVLSDVVGDPLDVIASGPTVPDPTTYAQAQAVLERRVPLDRIPRPVLDHLEAGRRGDLPETPKDPASVAPQVVRVVGNAAAAAAGAARAAREEGLRARVVSTPLGGEARLQAAEAAATARPGPGVWIWAGETTVTVPGSGRGGRNQEGALAAAATLEGDPALVFAALGTDGIDGPTDAAGGLVDGRTVDRGRAAGLDVGDHLERNDSHPYLRAVGDQLVTGPTGTNVGDLWLVWSTG